MEANHLHVRLETADPLGHEASRLLRQMRAESLSRYGDILDASRPVTNEPLVPRSVFLVARLEGRPVGCAALRPINAEVAEVKRMYVLRPVRRRGIARLLLAELEAKGALFGYTTLRLETGNRQPEAVALYESCGFRRIPSYGPHVEDPLSICFEKAVVRSAEPDASPNGGPALLFGGSGVGEGPPSVS
jgi:GNAT superfamily N-acetyltransferase